MPFPNQVPIPFSKSGIEAIRPGQKGCYGIYRGKVCIYVGKGDIRERMLSHFNGDNPCITRAIPTHWLSMVTPDMDVEERRLVRALTPSCNKLVG